MTGKPELRLPADFGIYGWEVESKGVYLSGLVEFDGRSIEVTFYDPHRLAQDTEDDLSIDGYSIPGYVVVVPKVTAEAMKTAATHIDPNLFA